MKRFPIFLLLFVVSFLMVSNAFGQKEYLFGEEQQLQFVVYVLGEVGKPGEYKVFDNTNVVELLAKAEGETEFSNLGSVLITRHKTSSPDNGWEGESSESIEKEIIKFNVAQYLKKKDGPPPPILKPGDIVYVTRNKWHKWRIVASVLRDLAIVVSTYFLYVRTFEN